MAPEQFAGKPVIGRDAVEKVRYPESCLRHLCDCSSLPPSPLSPHLQSYVYSLGMTMFAAMQYGLENDQVITTTWNSLASHMMCCTSPPSSPLPSLPSSQTPSVSEPLQQFLLGMIEDSLELRSSLQHVTKFSKQHTEEAEQELIDGLVTYILGNEVRRATSPLKHVSNISLSVSQ